MNFYERNKEKLVIASLILVFLSVFLPQPIKDNISDFFKVIPTYAVAFFTVVSIFIYRFYAEKKRTIELKEYAEKQDYDFYKDPDEAQISLFKEFKSIKTISNRDIFFNLLVPKDDNHTKPLIVTGISKVGNVQSSFTHHTQIFLYKNNVELPKFYMQRKKAINRVIGRSYGGDYQVKDIEPYEFKKKDFPHNKYYFFSEHPDIEDFISNEFIELLNTGINRKKALINIESNGKNLIFYKQWSRHTTEYIDYYLNLFKALKESLVKGDK